MIDPKKTKKIYTVIRILIKSNELIRCEQLHKNIVNQLPAGIKSSSIYLPTRKHTFSVAKAPHGYANHRNTFGYDTYKMCLNITSSEKLSPESFKELLSAIHTAKAIPGTDIKIQCKQTAILAKNV